MTSARMLAATSRQEQQTLLREAAKQIEAYQNLLALYGSAAYEIDEDICGRLTDYADRIDFSYLDETRLVMLEAAASSPKVHRRYSNDLRGFALTGRRTQNDAAGPPSPRRDRRLQQVLLGSAAGLLVKNRENGTGCEAKLAGLS